MDERMAANLVAPQRGGFVFGLILVLFVSVTLGLMLWCFCSSLDIA